MKIYSLCFVLCIFALGAINGDSVPMASDVILDMYDTCLGQLSTGCVKPKALAWLTAASLSDEIKITNDLSIVRTSADNDVEQSSQRSTDPLATMLNGVENFLHTHSIRISAPEFLKSEEARAFMATNEIGSEETIEMPLVNGNIAEGRGFVKKVMIPFLLGLKFKTTVLLPIAFALIALKTWKALTLGLLSMVLSAAMVIFKFAKPKVISVYLNLLYFT